MRKILLSAVVLGASFISLSARASIEDQLKNEGLVAEIHGAPKDMGHWVAVVRDPNDFFKFEFFSIFSEDSQTQNEFSKLSRHDRVRLWGAILNMPAPQRHIKVGRLVIEEKFQDLGSYHREAQIPEGFPGPDQKFRALVHFSDKAKKILVVEYKDAVLPVRVPASIQLADFYRNDIIEMRARIATDPHSPLHLKLLEWSLKEAILPLHGKAIERTGSLLLFPKSPQVKFDVFAVKESLPDGLSRQYTILNTENSELFAQIRAKLKGFWDAGDQSKVFNARNKLENPSIVVKIKGIGNVVDAGQANPQILVSQLADIELLTK